MWFKKGKMCADQIVEIRERILKDGPTVFKQFNIDTAILFGSKFDTKLEGISDVAVFVMPLPINQFWIFRQHLATIAKRTIDIYTQDDNPDFIKKVQEQGDIIFSQKSIV